MASSVYIIDTSSLTQAHRVYYPFDIAPSFWEFMKQQFNNGSFIYTNKVAFEIKRGNDALADWTQTQLSSGIEFDCHTDTSIMGHYGSIMSWGNSNSQYNSTAKRDFSQFDNADPFAVATAIEKSAIVVSQEISAPTSQKNIKLPDVCAQFGVDHIDTFKLLRTLGFTM